MNRLRSNYVSFTTISGYIACLVVALLCLVNSSFAQLTKADIDSLKAKAKAEGWTFEVGENSATQYSLDQLTGFKMPAVKPEGITSMELPAMTNALPPIFDWRTEKGMPPIRNQGGCGSCWAFATVGALECNIKIKDNKVVDLSEQYLVSCNNNYWGCQGGWWAHDMHMNALDQCSGTGAVMESHFPYVQFNAPCGCPYPHAYTLDGWGYVGQQWTTPSVSEMKQAIMVYGPISVAVSVNSAFQAYRGGVFNGCANGDINHAVVLVGWDDTQGVWFMRNSWGTGWGEAGYMRIPYGCSYIGYNATYVEYKGSLWFANDVTLAKAPADVSFTAETLAGAESWSWSFGDGGTATVQNPVHTYQQPGCYDVAVSIVSGGSTIQTINKACVNIHSDTLAGQQVSASAGKQTRVDIYLRNFLPLRRVVIPVSFGGPAGLSLDSMSTAGLRTAYIATQQFLHYDVDRTTFELLCGGAQDDLAPGTGAVLSLYLSVPPSATGQLTPVVIGEYVNGPKTYTPLLEATAGPYGPTLLSGTVSVCLGGDTNGSGTGPDLSDLSTLIAYLLGGVPLPSPAAANVDGRGAVDLTDLSQMISFLLTGAPMLTCAQ